MVEHKDWGQAEADRQDEMAKTAADPTEAEPEGEEFYSEIRGGESVIEMPEGDDILTRSVEEDEVIPADKTKGNSQAFEEEMDDL